MGILLLELTMSHCGESAISHEGAYRDTHARVNEDWGLQDRHQASSLLLTCSSSLAVAIVDDSSSTGSQKELDRVSSAGIV